VLKIKPPNYKFCPLCGNKLALKEDVDKERRLSCSDCNWVYYPRVAQSSNAIIVKGNKILLVKRARDPYKGTWMFPAGFVNFGEHPDETLIREVKEETGLKTKNIKFIKVAQTIDDPRSPGHLAFYYKVKVGSGDFSIEDKYENSDIGWFNIQNPPKIGWKDHKEMIKLLKLGKV